MSEHASGPRTRSVVATANAPTHTEGDRVGHSVNLAGRERVIAQLVNAVEALVGTLANPLRNDPTGGTDQPVTGTFWQAVQPTSDSGPAWTSTFGVSGAAFTSANASAAPAAVTDAPTAGKKLVIDDLIASTDTELTFEFTEETSGTIVLRGHLPANNGLGQLTTRGRIKLATADRKLMLQTSGAGNVAVTAVYHSED